MLGTLGMIIWLIVGAVTIVKLDNNTGRVYGWIDSCPAGKSTGYLFSLICWPYLWYVAWRAYRDR